MDLGLNLKLDDIANRVSASSIIALNFTLVYIGPGLTVMQCTGVQNNNLYQ